MKIKKIEKKLAVLLTGGIVTCTLCTDVSASTVKNLDSLTNINSTKNNVDSSVHFPNVPDQIVIFDKANPKDLVMKNIDFANYSLTSFSIDQNPINLSDLSINDNTITLSAKHLEALNLKPGFHVTVLEFSNGALYVNAVKIKVVDSSSIVAPPTDNIVESKPSIKDQVLNYDLSNPSELVVKDVNFDGTTLKYIYINGTLIYADELILGDDTITIPVDALSKLSILTGNYNISFKFSNNAVINSTVYLDVTGFNPILPPITDDSTNNDGSIDNDNSSDKDDSTNNDTIVRNPSIVNQILTFNLATPSDLVIKNVDFDGTTLNSIYINGNLISSDEFILNVDTITIPANVLSKLSIVPGNYYIAFNFSNNIVINDAVAIKVVNSPIVSVVFDKNNPTPIEITNIIPTGSKVNSITINNKEVAVVYSTLRTASNLPAVYVINDKLIIPAETLEYIGLNTPTYVIDVTLENGQTISRTVEVDVVDSSIKVDDTVTPPSTDDNNSVENTDKEDTSTGITTNTNTTINNSTIEKAEDEGTTTEKVTTLSSSLPKTGLAATTGLVSSLLAAMTSMLITRKKK